MSTRLETLTSLARELQRRPALDELLQALVDTAASLLETDRASIRLLDPSGTRLLAVCRAGEPLHEDPNEEFRLGEGLIGWIAQHLEPIRTDDAEGDPRFVQKPGLRGRMGSFLGVPVASGGVTLGVLSAVHPTPGHFTDEHRGWLTLLASMCAPHVELARLSRLATVDPLTGALNRRGLDRAFPEVEADESGYVVPLSVALVDVDHFKLVNDTHGHAVGDEVLRSVSRVLGNVLRGGDAVVRYGGEEFLLILPGAARAAASRVAERARKTIEETPLTFEGGEVRVTVSIGVAERDAEAGEGRDEVIARADAALYRAKNAGRNLVQRA